MRRTMIPLVLLAVGALACSLTGAPGSSINGIATSAAATLTALAPQAASAAPAATQASAASATPAGSATAAAASSATPVPTTAATAAGATAAPTTAVAATVTTAVTTAPTTAASAAAPTASAASAGCKLAYADQGQLFCVPESGTPQSLATGVGLFQPAISPDGALIAYQVVITAGVSQLWVAAVSEGGAAPHVLVGQDQLPSADGSQINSPNHYDWLAGTHTLVFDTRYIPASGAGGPGEYINADLWSVDADTGKVTSLLPAKQAGVFAASPDGHTIAISRGTGLDLINADGSHRRQNLITFPVITTYAEYTYKPAVQWSADGSYFTVGIPTQDPTAPNSAITFYKVSADGTEKLIGSQIGNFVFGSPVPPQIAPDGGHVVYGSVDASTPSSGTPVSMHMLTLQPGALANTVFDMQAAPAGWGWSPDSQVYAYSDVPGSGGGKLYATGPGVESPHVFADQLSAVSALRWVDGTHVVFLGQISGGEWALYRQISGGEPAAVQKIVGGLSDQATFDVRP